MTADNGGSSKIVEQVMRKLRITWDDETTKSRIESDMIPKAESVLRERIGIPDSEEFDFSSPSIENELFLAYCFYEWNDAEDDFYLNYEHRIAEARRKWEVIQYSKETGSADV